MTAKKYLLSGFLIVMTLMLMNGVYALAISSPYWGDNPLKISPGDSAEFKLVLVNSASSQDVTVGVDVVGGADIASITDASNVYTVPAGGNADVNVRVSVTGDSVVGGDYPVKFSVKTITSGDNTGSVNMGSAIDQSLPVVIVEKPKSAAVNSTTWYLVIAVVVLVVLIAIVRMRRRR